MQYITVLHRMWHTCYQKAPCQEAKHTVAGATRAGLHLHICRAGKGRQDTQRAKKSIRWMTHEGHTCCCPVRRGPRCAMCWKASRKGGSKRGWSHQRRKRPLAESWLKRCKDRSKVELQMQRIERCKQVGKRGSHIACMTPLGCQEGNQSAIESL
jgi:hypothetical protein